MGQQRLGIGRRGLTDADDPRARGAEIDDERARREMTGPLHCLAGPRLTLPPDRGDDGAMDGGDQLDAREAERLRRRDREAAAADRALMKPGMGKVFKQIQDAQRKAADADRAAHGSHDPPRRRPSQPR